MPPKPKVETRKPAPPIKTGFCLVGFCEGTKPRSPSGKPVKTCEYWTTCPCSCHKLITQLFEMSDQPRILIENPEYTPIKNPYWMPSIEEIAREKAILSIANGNGHPEPTEVAPTVATPALIVRAFHATPTGRAARGELEAGVNEVCVEWVAENYPWPCTPVFISDQIAKRQGIAAPSTGAISACFEKWRQLGYAVIEKKPLRFSGFTPEGKRVGLEVMKEQTKRAKKASRVSQARGH